MDLETRFLEWMWMARLFRWWALGPKRPINVLCKSNPWYQFLLFAPLFIAVPGAVNRHEDNTLGLSRIEITCAACGGHLGHVFKGEGFPTPSTSIRVPLPYRTNMACSIAFLFSWWTALRKLSLIEVPGWGLGIHRACTGRWMWNVNNL